MSDLFDTEHLFWLRHDTPRFEKERLRLIEEMISSSPPEVQEKLRQYQQRIDEARSTLSPDQFLKWMQQEQQEARENVLDQLQAAINLLSQKA